MSATGLEVFDPTLQKTNIWLKEIYGIGADARELPEGFKHKAAPDEPLALRQGRNDIGNVG